MIENSNTEPEPQTPGLAHPIGAGDTPPFTSPAASIGAACYVACEDPSVLVPSLRGVLDAADYTLTLSVPGNSQIRSKETVRYETPDTRISA